MMKSLLLLAACLSGIISFANDPKNELSPASTPGLCVGSYHVLQVRDGALYGWGDNTQGQLGLGAASVEYSPVRIGSAANWKMVTAANFHSLAIKTNGTLWAWGWGNSHEMGLGQKLSKTFEPVQVGKDTNWTSVSTAPDVSVALKKDGSLWVWGNNVREALGVGKTVNSAVYVPTRVGKDTDWVSATASQHMVLAIKKDGSLWIWGRKGGSAIFGVPVTEDVVTSPQRVGNDNDWAGINVHNRHGDATVIATKKDGSLWAWGSNRAGKLGTGSKDNPVTPFKLNIPASVRGMAIGTDHTILIKADGSLIHAGNFLKNIEVKSGQISNSLQFIPLAIQGKWVSVHKGMNFTLLQNEKGELWAFGTNEKGQLGHGVKNSSAVPVKVLSTPTPL